MSDQLIPGQVARAPEAPRLNPIRDEQLLEGFGRRRPMDIPRPEEASEELPEAPATEEPLEVPDEPVATPGAVVPSGQPEARGQRPETVDWLLFADIQSLCVDKAISLDDLKRHVDFMVAHPRFKE